MMSYFPCQSAGSRPAERIIIGCNARYSMRFGFTGKSRPIGFLSRKPGFL